MDENYSIQNLTFDYYGDSLTPIKIINDDGVFFISIDIGLELEGAAGPICWTRSPNNLQPTMKGWSCKGLPAGSPMSKSVSFLRIGKNSIVDGVMISYLFFGEIARYL